MAGRDCCMDRCYTAYSGHGVIACSALERAYRYVLIGDRPWVRPVYLKGERSLVTRRIAPRQGHHFMPASLLDSQFAALQEPGEDEHPIIASIDARLHDIVEIIVAKLRIPNQRYRGASAFVGAAS
jgi:gluconokinase